MTKYGVGLLRTDLATLRVAQSFRGNGETISKVRFYMKKVGSPTGSITVTLTNHTGTGDSQGIISFPITATQANLVGDYFFEIEGTHKVTEKSKNFCRRENKIYTG